MRCYADSKSAQSITLSVHYVHDLDGCRLSLAQCLRGNRQMKGGGQNEQPSLLLAGCCNPQPLPCPPQLLPLPPALLGRLPLRPSSPRACCFPLEEGTRQLRRMQGAATLRSAQQASCPTLESSPETLQRHCQIGRCYNTYHL